MIGEVIEISCETTALNKFKESFGFSPFLILTLACAVSPRHSAGGTGWQNTFKPPILFAQVAVL